MNRFEEIKSSKFERINQAEMSSVKGGGLCIRCLKRARKGMAISIGVSPSGHTTDFK